MTQIDVELIAKGLLDDVKLLACARPDQLASLSEWLEEAQDELTRAVEKARIGSGRIAA